MTCDIYDKISGIGKPILTELICLIVWNDHPRGKLYLNVLMGSTMLLRPIL